MILRTSVLTLALFSTGAFAQEFNVQALDEILTQKEGMVRVGDGLYYQKTATGESFVAYSESGKQVILEKMMDTRDALSARLALTHSESGQASLEMLDNQIDRLIHPPQPDEVVTGHCGDQATVYARALSSGGTSASAYAVDEGGGFSPMVSTTNYASASSDNHSNSQTTSTLTPATATVTDGRSCVAYSTATVNCSGDPNPPTIEAFATSMKPSGC